MKKRSLLLAASAILGATSCAPANKVGQIVPDHKYGKSINGNLEVEGLLPKVDVLFVIDNSGSMASYQSRVAQNIQSFLNHFLKMRSIDFHIGVITTDNDGTKPTDCCGILIGAPESPFVTRNTPNVKMELANRMVVGTSGSATEKVFDPIFLALSSPKIDGPNRGFLRPDAHLAIVIITDAEDQSEKIGSAEQMQNFLESLKPRGGRVLSYGALVVKAEAGCMQDSGDPIRLQQFLKLSPSAGGNLFSLCDSDFGSKLTALGKDIVARVARNFPLARKPVVDTIRVQFGTQIMPRDILQGWFYNAASNAIEIGEDVVWSEQPEGTQLTISYDYADGR